MQWEARHLFFFSLSFLEWINRVLSYSKIPAFHSPSNPTKSPEPTTITAVLLAVRWGFRSAGPVGQEASSGDLPAEGEEEEGHGTSDLWQEFRRGGEKDPQAKYWLRSSSPATINVSSLNTLMSTESAHSCKHRGRVGVMLQTSIGISPTCWHLQYYSIRFIVKGPYAHFLKSIVNGSSTVKIPIEELRFWLISTDCFPKLKDNSGVLQSFFFL